MKKIHFYWGILLFGAAALACWMFFPHKRPGSPERLLHQNVPAPTLQPNASDLTQRAALAASADLLLGRMKEALDRGDKEKIRAVANVVRKKAIHDQAYLNALGEALTTSREKTEVRQVVALILGTLEAPEAENNLLNALLQTADPQLKKYIVIALGSWKEPENQDSFGGLDNPWVMEHPSGIQVMVKTKITNSKVSQALLSFMSEAGDESLRVDVIRTLSHSLEETSIRNEFYSALNGAHSPGTLGQIGSALAGWVATAPEDKEDEKSRIMDSLLTLAGKAEQSDLRFATEEQLRGLPFTKNEIEKTTSILQNVSDFDTKYWALGLLAQHADYVNAGSLEKVTSLYTDTLQRETNGKLREKAAESLGSFHRNRAATGALLQSLQNDAGWNVRAAAAEALGRQTSDTDVTAELLRIAEQDMNPVVREAAQKSLEKIRSRKQPVKESER